MNMRVSFAGVTDTILRFERLFPRRMPVRTVVGYAVYTAALFLCFFVYTFPVDVIAERLANRASADSGWAIRYDGVRLLPWAGFRFANLSFEAPGKSGDPAIRLGKLTVRPSLRTFLGGGFRQATFRGEGYGGTFSGAVDWTEVPTLALRWTDLNLAEASVLSALLQGNWTGRFSGETIIKGKEFPATLDGGGRLDVKGVALTRGSARGFKVPDLHFAQGAGEFEVKAGNVEIRSLKLAGSEIDVELRGQLSLRKPIAQSGVNTILNVRPIPGVAPEIENALRILNGNRPPQNGAYSYTFYGTLSAPAVR